MNKPPFLQWVERWHSAVVARTEIPNFTGGTYSERYLANEDCAGRGPAGRIRIGRKVVYPVDSLVAWLESRSTVIPDKKNNE